MNRKIKIALGRIFYFFAKNMPVSYARPNFGSKMAREFCGKLILTSCGQNVNIEKGAVFSSKIEIGNNSGIGENARLTGRVIIGNDVMMGPDCVIYYRNHAFSRTDVTIHSQGFQEEKTVYIGNDVWIGGRVTILPGVHIGNHCIVGAAAVVTKDVPDYAIVAGNPAKIIRMRE